MAVLLLNNPLRLAEYHTNDVGCSMSIVHSLELWGVLCFNWWSF